MNTLILLAGYFTLALDDIKNRSISVIHLGIVIAIGTGSVLLFHELEGTERLYGFILASAISVLLFTTRSMGAGDGILLIFSGFVLGWVRFLQMFYVSIILLAIYALCLTGVTGFLKHDLRNVHNIPYIPFLFLALLGVMICA